MRRSVTAFVTTYPQTNKQLKEPQSAALVAGNAVSLDVLMKLSHLVFYEWPLDSTKVLKPQIRDLKSQTGEFKVAIEIGLW